MGRFPPRRECTGPGLLSAHFLLFLSAMFISLTGAPTRALAAQVTLAWDASTGSDLAGYKLYYGESSRQYTVNVDVRKRTTCTVKGLKMGKRYFFAATAYDTHGNESDYSQEVSYRVPGSNQAPIAVDDTASTREDRRVIIDVLANDSDADGDALSVVETSQGAKGSVHINGTTVTYTPKTNWHGRDSFTYTVSDGKGGSAAATVDVLVAAVNDAPVASNRGLPVWENTEKRGWLAAEDPDRDALTYSVVRAAAKGLVTLTNAEIGSYIYAPYSGAKGTDSFTFKANDGLSDSNTATVSVTIRPHVRLWLEAEEGYVNPPMRIAADANASRSRYVLVPYDAGNLANPKREGGYAEYTFEVPEPGRYVLFARVMSNGPARNSFFVSVDHGEYFRWDTALGAANMWIWDKMTKGSLADAVGFFLKRGVHTLSIKQCKAGAKIDKIGIVSSWEGMSGTIYEDAEDGTVRGWDVYDAVPAGAQISNVFDEDRRCRVIELKGSGLNNGYRLRRGNSLEWSNSKDHVIEWSSKYDEDFEVSIETETTAGIRYIQYSPRSEDLLGRGKTVRLGLGRTIKDGQWYRFIRDLQADLEKAQPRVRILKVNSFLIRGSGRVDDIKLRSSP